jgi:hypothetical protein
MEDFVDDFDDFDDDYDEGESMGEDSFEDKLEEEMDEMFTEDVEPDDEPIEAESKDDDFTAKDAFVLGGAFGFGYEEGLRERKRRKRKPFSDDESD